jgi:serine/threonine-protein kinase
VGQRNHDPVIGQVIGGRYAVLSRLGSGGMGVVYRALQEQLDRPVALKLLSARVGTDAQIEERFRTEARAASQLANPHTVTIYDFGATPDGSLFIAMQLVEGESLRSRLARGPLSVRHALTIAAQVCDSLAEAHNHRPQIIHRDIKPDNIMLRGTPGGEPFAIVLDFGLARFTDSRHLTATDSVIGTPAYMSPEQARSGGQIDIRSDIYAVGIVLFEMLTGQVPLESPEPVQTLFKHAFEAPPRLIEKNPSLDAPESVQQLVSEMLAKAQDDRPGSALEVQTRLLGMLQELPFDESAVSTEVEVARVRPMLTPRPRSSMSPAPRTIAPRPAPVEAEEPVDALDLELTPQSQDLERRAARLRRRLRLRLTLLTAAAVLVVGGSIGLVVANQRAASAGSLEPAPIAHSDVPAIPPAVLPPVAVHPPAGGGAPAAVAPAPALAPPNAVAAGASGTTGVAGAGVAKGPGTSGTGSSASADRAGTAAPAAPGKPAPMTTAVPGDTATVDVTKPASSIGAKTAGDAAPLSREALQKLKL